MNLQGQQLAALVDTGASMNLINSSFIHTYYPSFQKSLKFGCGPISVGTKGSLELEYQILDISLTSTFLVIDNLQEDMILGFPWIQEQHVVFDGLRQCLYFGRNVRRTVYTLPSPCQTNQIDIAFDLDHLQPQLQSEYRNVLSNFSHLFSDTLQQPVTRTVQHDLRLTSDKIVKVKPYPLSDHKKAILNEQVTEMIAAGVIEPSTSAFSSSPVIIERADKKPRFCVDFRQLNEVTEDESSFLPKISDTLKELGTAKIFTSLDLRSGYWQIPLTERAKPLTAFSTPDGAHFQFTVMPFGLKNAPSTFQSLMTQEVLPGCLRKFSMVYLDDIIVFSSTHEEHQRHLQLVLERLDLHNLHCSINKCRFAKPNLVYLGHEINAETNTPQPKHLEQIQNFPVPRNKREL